MTVLTRFRLVSVPSKYTSKRSFFSLSFDHVACLGSFVTKMRVGHGFSGRHHVSHHDLIRTSPSFPPSIPATTSSYTSGKYSEYHSAAFRALLFVNSVGAGTGGWYLRVTTWRQNRCNGDWPRLVARPLGGGGGPSRGWGMSRGRSGSYP